MVGAPLRPAVFLDRDGVLNRSGVRAGKPVAPRRSEEFELYPETAPCLAALRQAGYALAVVTNQPDVGHGLIAADELSRMHARLQTAAPVDFIGVCPHRQDDGCACRKPRTGLLEQASAALGIDPARSFMIGDRASDILAGRRFGCHTIFIDRGYAEPGPDHADHVVASLDGAVRRVLSGCIEDARA